MTRFASPPLLTQTDAMPEATANWLAAHKADIRPLWPIGGTNAIGSGQETSLGNLIR